MLNQEPLLDLTPQKVKKAPVLKKGASVMAPAH